MARTPTADLLKGIAALLMIQVHIIELFATENVFNSNIGKILLFLGGPPVAPIFLVFLGYFIASSQKTTKQLVIRGIKIILLGLALNVALNLNLLVSVGRGEYPHVNIFQYLFGVDVLPHAGLSIIIIALLKHLMDKHIAIPLLLALSAASLGMLLPAALPETGQGALSYVKSFIYGNNTWSYFPIFPWLSYSLAGIAFYKLTMRYDFSIFRALKAKLVIAVLSVLFLIFTIQFAISVASDLQSYYHHGIVFFGWTVVFLLFYGFWTNQLEKVAGSSPFFVYLRWLGNNITAVYVIQWILIGNTATEIYRSISSPMWLITAFIVITAASSGLCYLWVKIQNHYTPKKVLR